MVISGVNTVTYNGDGITTAWPYTFEVTDASEIRIQLNNADGTAVIVESDYYVDLINSTVYYPGYAPGSEPPEAEQPPKVQTGQTITVYREIPITQESDLGEKWPFEVIEKGLDKLTMIAQQIDSGTKRTIDNALASMEMLADVVVDSDELQHITDQYNAIDANAAAAAESEENAAASALLSEKWANYTGDVVADGEYSAKKYATDAAISATNAANSDTSATNIAAALTAYLETKETLTAPAVDPLLTISGAAADAKVTGENINGLNKQIQSLHAVAVSGGTNASTAGTILGLSVEVNGCAVKINGTVSGSGSTRVVSIQSNPVNVYTNFSQFETSCTVTNTLIGGHTYRLHAVLVSGTYTTSEGTFYAPFAFPDLRAKIYSYANGQQGTMLFGGDGGIYIPLNDETVGALGFAFVSGQVFNNAVIVFYIEDTTISSKINIIDAQTLVPVYGIDWRFGTMTNDGEQYDYSHTGIVCKRFPIDDIIVRSLNSYQKTVFYYDANGTYLAKVAKWGDISIRDEAPQNAVSFRIYAQNSNGTEIDSVDSGVANIPVLMSPYRYAEKMEDILFPYNITEFVSGAIKASNGTGKNEPNPARIRTNDYYRIGRTKVAWGTNAWQFMVVYYDASMNFVGFHAFSSTSCTITQDDFSGAVYVRFVVRREDGANIETAELPSGCYIKTDDIEKYQEPGEGTRDIPQSSGVLNTIARAKQLTTLEYTTTNDFPVGSSTTYPAGTDITGLIYSSVRQESLYVPNCVSLNTFMTAIKNPNSYAYTRTSTAYNSKNYFGNVCSSFVSYCLNLPCVYTTHQIGELEDVQLLESQDVMNIRLGDMLLKVDDHIVLVTDIYRDTRGRVIKAEISDSWAPFDRSRLLSASYINTHYLQNGYKIYRYAKIDSVPYTPSQWVAVEGEQAVEPVYNTNLSPRRGDNSNWPLGETVEIDVLDVADYTTAILYKGDTVVNSSSVSQGDVLQYSDLTAGKYRACLSDGITESSVYFAVVDTNVTATALGNKDVRIEFDSSVGTPSWYAFCYADPNDSDYMAVFRAYPLTDTDKANGYVIGHIDENSHYNNNTWLVKVEFDTEYGTQSSDLVPVAVSN